MQGCLYHLLTGLRRDISNIESKYLTLNFKDSINGEVSTFIRCDGLSGKFYIKVLSIETEKQRFIEGQTSIGLNINTMKI